MNILKWLRRLGILRFGAEGAVYHDARERPLGLQQEDILDSDAEVMEVKVPENKFSAGQPLKDCSWPKESVVGAVVRRNSAFIPSGMTVIQPGDNLVIFFSRSAARNIDKFFSS